MGQETSLNLPSNCSGPTAKGNGASLLQSPTEGNSMPNLPSIIKQLKQERDRVEKQLSGLNAALTAFAGVYSGGKPVRKRRKMSAKSRAKIAAAQRARWAKVKAKQKR